MHNFAKQDKCLIELKYGCFLVLLVAHLGAAAALFRVDPYLQNSSTNAVTIMCIASEAATGKVVLYQSSGTFIDSLPIKTLVIPNCNYYRCEARLAGLEPGKEYAYTVSLRNSSNQTDISAKANFMTLNPGALNCHFSVVNDLHDDTNEHATLSQWINAFKPEFIFYNGDCWNDPSTNSNGKTVFDNLAAYVKQANHKSIPLNYIAGNHEWRGFTQYFSYLFNTDLLNYNDALYSLHFENAFTHANIRFIYMDCGEDGDKRVKEFQPSRKRQTLWLKQEIAKPEFKNARYRVLLIHLPVWGSNYQDSCSNYWRDAIKNAVPKFSLMLCGHTHGTNLLAANSDHPFPVMISGKGCYIQCIANQSELKAEVRNSGNTVIKSVTVSSETAILASTSDHATSPFILPVNGRYTIELYNSKGVKIRSFLNENSIAGEPSILTNICKEANGIYYCKYKINNSYLKSTRVVILK